MNSVAKVIKKVTKLSLKDFCETELHVEYKAFMARAKKNRLYPAEIFYICWRTRRSIKEIFGMPWHEVFIAGQGGEVVNKVREIIESLSETDRAEMVSLIGFEESDPKTIPVTLQDHAVTTLDVTDTPKAEETKPKPTGLESLFVDTYKPEE